MLKKMQFRDFITLQRGFDLPVKEIIVGPYPVVGSTSIIGYHNQYKILAPGVTTGRSGSLGIIQYIRENYWPHNTSLWVRDFKGNLPKYVYYFLQTLDLRQFNSGAGVPTLNRNHLNNLAIEVHHPSDQQKIATVLSAYDDLIENNTRRIKILEEIAQAIYREWFVHFRFPGHDGVRMVESELGMIPEGWEVIPIREALILQRGFDLTSYNREDGDVPIYGSTGLNGYHSVAKVKGPGIVTGRSGTLGQVHYVENDFWPHNTALWVKEFKKITPIFALFLLREMKLEQYNGGVAVPTLDRNVIHRITVIIPNRELIGLFDQRLSPIFPLIQNYQKQNINLHRTRDLLLPKLIFGNLDVSELDIIISETMT